MSHQTIQTTKSTSDSSSKEVSDKKLTALAFLEKPVIDTMEDFYKFESYMQRPTVEKRPCIVTDELFDILSQGDTGSLIWIKNVPVINVAKKQDGIDKLSSKQHTHTVIV